MKKKKSHGNTKIYYFFFFFLNIGITVSLFGKLIVSLQQENFPK